MKNSFFLLGLLFLVFGQAGAQVFFLNANLPPVLEAFAGNDQAINPGDSVRLGGNPSADNGYGAYTYLWSPQTGLNDPTASRPWARPSETTTYLLKVVDGHHCIAEDEVVVKVESSGVDAPIDWFSVTVFPNPAKDLIQIWIKGGGGRTQILVLNSLGQKINESITDEPAESQLSLDVNNWVRGLYYLIIHTNSHSYRQSIVIL
jgi:hypothetical protein